MDVERFFDVEASVRSEEVDFGDEDSSSSSDESPEEETCEVEGRLGAHDEGADLVRSLFADALSPVPKHLEGNMIHTLSLTVSLSACVGSEFAVLSEKIHGSLKCHNRCDSVEIHDN